MSQENVEIARQAAESLADGDFDTWLGLHAPECEFAPLIVGVEGGEPYRGHDGCRAFWEDIHAAFVEWRPQIERARECGDAAVVTIRFQGRGRDSGIPVDQLVWQVFRTKDGKAVWWRIYASEREALEAAGLEE